MTICKIASLILYVFCSNLAHASLQAKFEHEKRQYFQGTQTLPGLSPKQGQAYSQYSYLFVDGILGDFSQNLYKEIQAYLSSELPLNQLQIVRPSSWASVDENADFLTQVLSQPSSKPRIVIAHSRGAAELFRALLKNPDLFERAAIDRVILVQGAFSGSPLAEYLEGLLGRFARDFIPRNAIDGRLFWQRKLSLENQRLFQERVLFVRSRAPIENIQLGLKPSALYLNHYYSAFENDGLLLTLHQRVLGFGVDLGVLKSDHLSLLGSNTKHDVNQVLFIRALLDHVLAL